MTVQKVEARFWVKEIVHHHNGGQGDQPVTIKLAAAYNDGKGNEDWSKWTPQGDISMMVTNPAAVAMFELGKHYKIEFSPV
jgi:hypothetical protein